MESLNTGLVNSVHTIGSQLVWLLEKVLSVSFSFFPSFSFFWLKADHISWSILFFLITIFFPILLCLRLKVISRSSAGTLRLQDECQAHSGRTTRQKEPGVMMTSVNSGSSPGFLLIWRKLVFMLTQFHCYFQSILNQHCYLVLDLWFKPKCFLLRILLFYSTSFSCHIIYDSNLTNINSREKTSGIN